MSTGRNCRGVGTKFTSPFHGIRCEHSFCLCTFGFVLHWIIYFFDLKWKAYCVIIGAPMLLHNARVFALSFIKHWNVILWLIFFAIINFAVASFQFDCLFVFWLCEDCSEFVKLYLVSGNQGMDVFVSICKSHMVCYAGLGFVKFRFLRGSTFVVRLPLFFFCGFVFLSVLFGAHVTCRVRDVATVK